MKINCLGICLLLFVGMLHGQEPVQTPNVKGSFGYADIGIGPLPLLVPTFGLGCRTQYNHHGWDLSLHAASVVVLTEIKGSLLHHYYFNPCFESQFYSGLGIGFGALFSKHDDTLTFLSPEFAFGKEYTTDTGGLRFFQVQVSFPTFYSNKGHHFSHHPFYMPLVVFSYGIGF